jgi:hypothetical protein
MPGSMYGGCGESTRRAEVLEIVTLLFAKHRGTYIDDKQSAKRLYLKKRNNRTTRMFGRRKANKQDMGVIL